MTYISQEQDGKAVTSVTFNGVGIGQLLPPTTDIHNTTLYPVTDHVNANDIIGTYGDQLGQTIYRADKDPSRSVSATEKVILSVKYMVDAAVVEGTITEWQGAAYMLWWMSENAAELLGTWAKDAASSATSIASHGMSEMLVKNSSGDYVLTSSTSASNVQSIADAWKRAADGVGIVVDASKFTWDELTEQLFLPGASLAAAANIVATIMPSMTQVTVDVLQNYLLEITGTTNVQSGDEFANYYTLASSSDNHISTYGGDDTVYRGSQTNTSVMNIISLGAGNDTAYGGDGKNQIHGGSGNDIIYGGSNHDILYGDAGNDTLYGGAGNDRLDGGTGDDVFFAGEGDDTYIFGVGFGRDQIASQTGKTGADTGDTIRFVSGLTHEDIKITRSEQDLVFEIEGTDDYITVIDYFAETNLYFRIQALFEDGTLLTDNAIREVAEYYIGTEGNDTKYGSNNQSNKMFGYGGNDTLHGNSYNDQLYGGAGNDVLVGGSGMDILDGGSGDDILDGGNNMDTYLFGRGYGRDTVTSGNYNSIIRFHDGVARADLHIERSHTQDAGAKNDLLITILETGDTLVIKDYFAYTTKPIFQFHDNSYLTEQDIATAANTYVDYVGHNTLRGWDDNGNTIYGLYGDDTIYGAAGDDTLVGGTGNDKLYGGAGNDTYVFDAGFGSDIIEDQSTSSTADKIVFGAGISAVNTIIKRVDQNINGLARYDVEITFTNSNDHLLIKNFYGDEQGRIESIHFTQGNITWSLSYITETMRYLYGTTDNDSIYGYADQTNIIYGGDGDDYIHSNDWDSGEIYGGAGDDSIYGSGLLNGGTGNDSISGGRFTDDTYIYNLGDGNDVIYEHVGEADTSLDTLRFGPGITPSGLTLSRPVSSVDLAIADLIITINSTGHTITLKNFFPYVTGTLVAPIPQYMFESHGIERIVFDDNTVWTADDLYEQYKPLIGTSGNDEITGLSTDDIIYGGAGDDDLYGYYGDDVLDGGAGDDLLRGAYGSDTYRFGRGYGTDTIDDADYSEIGQSTDKVIFNSDVDPSDIEVSRGSSSMFDLAYRDIHLHIAGTTDTLIIKQYFMSDDNNQEVATIEEIHFSDATVWELSDVNAALAAVPNVINGTSGMDILIDTASNDTINAGDGDDMIIMMNGGNDTINGGAGNDTYYWIAPGFGQDKIVETSGTDTASVTGSASDMIFEQIGNDLRLSVYGTTDSVTVQDWYTSSDRQVETFTSMTDMGSISNTQVEQLIQAMATFSTNNNGMTWSQALASQPNDVQSIVSQYWTVPTA